MRRLVWHGRETMRLEESEQPLPQPQKDEVLLKVRAVGICGTDIHIMNGAISSATPPMVLGHEFAGEIAEIGKNVGNVRVGDRITADSVVGCGHCPLCRRGAAQFCAEGSEFGISRDGGCQDYLIVPKANVHRIPDTITFEEAAILDTEIYNAVRKCKIQRGDKVLVLGAGPIGIVACQVARILGAGYVALADVLDCRVHSAEALGVADRYLSLKTRESETSPPQKAVEGFDLVIDCAGAAESVKYALDVARPAGKILLYGVYEKTVDRLDLNKIVLKDTVVYGAQSDRNGWQNVIHLVQSGLLNLKSLITHRFPLDQGAQAYDLVRQREDGVIKAVLLL